MLNVFSMCKKRQYLYADVSKYRALLLIVASIISFPRTSSVSRGHVAPFWFSVEKNGVFMDSRKSITSGRWTVTLHWYFNTLSRLSNWICAFFILSAERGPELENMNLCLHRGYIIIS